jgi:hypothetical protein
MSHCVTSSGSEILERKDLFFNQMMTVLRVPSESDFQQYFEARHRLWNV